MFPRPAAHLGSGLVDYLLVFIVSTNLVLPSLIFVQQVREATFQMTNKVSLWSRSPQKGGETNRCLNFIYTYQVTHFTRQPDAPFHLCNSYFPGDGQVGEQDPQLRDLYVPPCDSLVRGSTGFRIGLVQVNLTVSTVIDPYFHKLRTFNRNLPWQRISKFNTKFNMNPGSGFKVWLWSRDLGWACMSDGLLSDADAAFWVMRDGDKLYPILPHLGIWSWGTISIFKCNAIWGYFSISKSAEEFYKDLGE